MRTQPQANGICGLTPAERDRYVACGLISYPEPVQPAEAKPYRNWFMRLKPIHARNQRHQRMMQRMCMARLRAERRVQSTDTFPPRIRRIGRGKFKLGRVDISRAIEGEQDSGKGTDS